MYIVCIIDTMQPEGNNLLENMDKSHFPRFNIFGLKIRIFEFHDIFIFNVS